MNVTDTLIEISKSDQIMTSLEDTISRLTYYIDQMEPFSSVRHETLRHKSNLMMGRVLLEEHDFNTEWVNRIHFRLIEAKDWLMALDYVDINKRT